MTSAADLPIGSIVSDATFIYSAVSTEPVSGIRWHAAENADKGTRQFERLTDAEMQERLDAGATVLRVGP